MQELKLSIIVPVYNLELWVSDCLNSFLGLNQDDFEMIVVNDGSKDKTLEVVESYRNKFKNFKLVDQVNQGQSVARNKGIEIAEGRYIFFCDGDDYINHQELHLLLQNTLDLNLDIGIGNGKNLKDNIIGNNLFKDRWISRMGVLSGSEYYLKANKIREFYITPCISLYKTEFMKRNNLSFYPGIIHEDEEFAPRVFALAIRVKYLPHKFYIRRYRIGSITKNNKHKYLNKRSCPSFVIIIKSLANFIENSNLGQNQKDVIKHGIHKAFLEILRRDFYYKKESIQDMSISEEARSELKNILSTVGLSLKQRWSVFRFELKIKFV